MNKTKFVKESSSFSALNNHHLQDAEYAHQIHLNGLKTILPYTDFSKLNGALLTSKKFHPSYNSGGIDDDKKEPMKLLMKPIVEFKSTSEVNNNTIREKVGKFNLKK